MPPDASRADAAMSTDAVAFIGFISLFAMMLLRVPVGIAMGTVGVLGFGYIIGDIGPALKLLSQSPIRTATTTITLKCLPFTPPLSTFFPTKRNPAQPSISSSSSSFRS